MKRPVEPSKDDLNLFRNAVEGARPLPQKRVPPWRDYIPPRPVKREEDEASVIDEMVSDEWLPEEMETGEELHFARDGLQHSVLKKLRRGQYALGAELDLHGLTVVEARQALSQFIQSSEQRCVRIIHGKGNGSFRQQPILKSKVNLWLRQWDRVLAFSSARPCDGGTGAVYVLLKRRR